MSEPYRSSARFVLETEDWPSKDPLGEIDVAYHARALDDKVAEIYRFYIVPASNIRRSGMSRADSTNVCYDPHPVAPRDHLALRVAPGSRATNARRVATLDRILPLAREYTEANCDQEQHKVGNDRHAFGWQDAVCAVSLGVGCLPSFQFGFCHTRTGAHIYSVT